MTHSSCILWQKCNFSEDSGHRATRLSNFERDTSSYMGPFWCIGIQTVPFMTSKSYNRTAEVSNINPRGLRDFSVKNKVISVEVLSISLSWIIRHSSMVSDMKKPYWSLYKLKYAQDIVTWNVTHVAI
jgi:hypothetical protein